jgi:four helix bundle protein
MGEKPHKRLELWRKSVDLVVTLYEATANFPSDERFGIVAQMRRAAVSIPSNIAEGAARGSKRFFTSALQIARASLSELDTQIVVSKRLGYLDDATATRLVGMLEEVERMLNGLIRATQRKVAAGILASAFVMILLSL